MLDALIKCLFTRGQIVIAALAHALSHSLEHAANLLVLSNVGRNGVIRQPASIVVPVGNSMRLGVIGNRHGVAGGERSAAAHAPPTARPRRGPKSPGENIWPAPAKPAALGHTGVAKECFNQYMR